MDLPASRHRAPLALAALVLGCGLASPQAAPAVDLAPGTVELVEDAELGARYGFAGFEIYGFEEGVSGLLPRADGEGLAASRARGYAIEEDREAAIRLAVGLAQPADVVVIAGKGHEDYQEIAGVRRPFDDRAIAATLTRSP